MNAQSTSNTSSDLDVSTTQDLFRLSQSVRAMGALYGLFAFGWFCGGLPFLYKIARYGALHKFWIAVPLVALPFSALLLAVSYGMYTRPAWGRSLGLAVFALAVIFNLLEVAYGASVSQHKLSMQLATALFAAFFVIHLLGGRALLRARSLFGAHRLSHAQLRALSALQR